jgi:hypothetical protein
VIWGIKEDLFDVMLRKWQNPNLLEAKIRSPQFEASLGKKFLYQPISQAWWYTSVILAVWKK